MKAVQKIRLTPLPTINAGSDATVCATQNSINVLAVAKNTFSTKWTSTDSWWPSTRGLCWNVFILMANEVAGIRKPEMDPDFRK